MTTTVRPDGVPPTDGPPEGDAVGDYRLLALIGEGGMGVVHLARGADGRRVALKVLRPYVVGDAEARERLAREVASLRLVRSHRVAEVLDADPYAVTPYVATRYVPGLSVHEHVREEGPITGPDLLHFADCLAEALAAVHAVGVLHRDVKPSNVLMEGRSPVLIDFGLARLAEDSRLTRTGWLLGTPGYLAPEILYGDDATPASDVHAWAATVAFAATGRPPYGRGPAMAVMDRVRRAEHDLSGVPEPVAGLLRAALAVEPLERPSLFEIRRWLAAQHAGTPVDLRPGLLVAPAPEPWTMPVAARERPAPTQVRPDEGLGAPTTTPTTTPTTAPAAPLVAPAAPAPGPAPRSLDGAPRTQVLPASGPGERVPDPLPPGMTPLEPEGRGLRRAQLAGLGLVAATAVAAAPYAALIGLLVLVLALRTVSVGQERLARRRMLRGGPRWFDGPTTVVASPGYVLLASVGSVAVVAWAVAAGLAVGVVEAVLHVSLVPGLLGVGLAVTLAGWWGPGSLRLRSVVHAGVRATSRRETVGWSVVVASVVLTCLLVGVLAGGGPIWSPATHAPWGSGFLATVARSL